jgi:dienelactone hydrolase
MKLRFFLSLLLTTVSPPLFAQSFIPPAQSYKATPGDALLTDYFRNEVAALSRQCLADVKSLDDWKSKREEYRRQLQEMLGLWPMPQRTDLRPEITGRIESEQFMVEKLHFQASPGLYVTANLYLPKNLEKPAPTILYECGHWRSISNGISYGNKAVYQMDGAWYARNGYVCLVPDTLLAGEIQGIHTGTRDNGLWWWNSRGYTPAGVEAWFGIRALDYLCTRSEVDTNHFGITGHSGGGAYSWMVTALDDRIKAAAPLAGMTDLKHHIVNNLMDSHCDCNFPINTYRWDFPQVAALVAPRPLLIGGTDKDHIFPLDGTKNIHDKVHRIYELFDATNKLGLVIAPGIHDEVPELRLAVMRWFNLHLKGVRKEDEKPVVVDTRKFFTPQQLRVFDTLPADASNAKIADTFVPLDPSRSSRREEALDGKSKMHRSRLTSAAKGEEKVTDNELRAALRERAFSGWPVEETPTEPKRAFSAERDGVRFSAWDFTSQHDVSLRLYLLESAKAGRTKTIRLTVLDSAGWSNWIGAVRMKFEGELSDERAAASGQELPHAEADQQVRPTDSLALAYFAPRGVGLTAWSGDEKRQARIRRRFMLLGQTLDGMRVWDIRRAIQAAHSVRGSDSTKVELHAEKTMAVNALYAALFEPTVHILQLVNLPKSHTEGPDYLGILKLTDISRMLDLVGARAELDLRTEE